MSAILKVAVGIVSCACFLGTDEVQVKVSIEKMSFKVADAFEPGAAVSGDLRIPDSKLDRLRWYSFNRSGPDTRRDRQWPSWLR